MLRSFSLFFLLVASSVALNSIAGDGAQDSSANPTRPRHALMARQTCGQLVHFQSGAVLLSSLPPFQLTRFAGLLVQPLQEGSKPAWYITPYMAPEAHASLIHRAMHNHNGFRSLWMGELELENISHGEPHVVLRRGNETSGEWAEWAGLIAPEQARRATPALPSGAQHENTVDHLRATVEKYLPKMLDERSEFISYSMTDPAAPHLDPELNKLVAYFREQNAMKGYPNHKVNINHDIRTPINLICMGYHLVLQTSKLPPAQRAETEEYVATAIKGNSGVVLGYLNILQRQYPDDEPLKQARLSLRAIDSRELNNFQKHQTLNQLANLSETLEFLSTVDQSSVVEIPLE